MNSAFALQTAASAVAVGLLVALAAWARIGRPSPPLDETRARALLAEEFPHRVCDAVWISMDGKGALAKSGAMALVVCLLGDGWVARQLPWAQALAASLRGGRVSIDLGDVGAPRAELFMAAWPPRALDKPPAAAKEQAA